MASYPQSIVSFPTYHDYSDIVYAQNDNNIEAEITAIETTLGTNPHGLYPTVRQRLDAADSVAQSSSHLKIQGAKGESYSRTLLTSAVGTAAASGTLVLGTVDLIAGVPVTYVNIATGSQAAVSPTHQWMILADVTGNIVATSADLTTTPISANMYYQGVLNTIITGITPNGFTPVYTGLYYVGYMFTAATPPSVVGITLPTAWVPMGFAPFLCATGGTGLTVPLPVGTGLAPVTISSQYPHIWVA